MPCESPQQNEGILDFSTGSAKWAPCGRRRLRGPSRAMSLPTIGYLLATAAAVIARVVGWTIATAPLALSFALITIEPPIGSAVAGAG